MPAYATLIGDTVTTSIETPFPFSAATAESFWPTTTHQPSVSNTVGSGVEFFYAATQHQFPYLKSDLSDSSITLSNALANGSTSFGLFALISWTDLDWIGSTGEIVGFTLSTVGTSNLDSSDVAFGSNWVRLDISNVGWSPNSYATVDLITRHVGSVPDSGSTAILTGLGLFCLSGLRRLINRNGT